MFPYLILSGINVLWFYVVDYTSILLVFKASFNLYTYHSTITLFFISITLLLASFKLYAFTLTFNHSCNSYTFSYYSLPTLSPSSI